jgi:simple sugar transport system substrate-binding protein
MTDGHPRTSRRALLRAGGLSAAAGAFAAYGHGNVFARGPAPKAGDFPETPPWNFVFVNHVTTNPFFTPTQYGISDAASLLGIPTPQWTGSETSDIPEMVNAFEAAIAAEADGIAVCLVDTEAFNEPVQAALDAGIPVLSYNADTPNARLSYTGQDLFGSGVSMGERIVDLCGEGKVGLFIATPGQLNIQPRIDGAIQAIEDSGAAIEYEQVETSAELPEELNRIEAWYLGNTDAVGMFAVDAGSTQGVGQVVQSQSARDNALTGAGGYDLLPMTVQLVADGVLDFTIDQQPYLQGFLPVIYLYLSKLSGGVVLPPETNTGLVFLDADGAGLFLNTESRFEGDSDEQKIVEPVEGAPTGTAPAGTAPATTGA